MNTAIIYATKTGHSKKIATAIAKGLNIQAQDVKTNPKLQNHDLLFLVGGLYGNQSTPELIAYVKGLDNTMVKKVILVTSCASKKAKQTQVRTLLEEKNIEVIQDEFICQGNILLVGLGHPNKEDIANAVAFAKKYV